MSYSSAPAGKDPQLWHLAQKRTSFKGHLMTYLIVNTGLWLIWYFTGGRTNANSIPWPAWSSFGWGIGLAAHFIGAYVNTGFNSVEKEYDKLAQKQTK